VTDTSKDRAGDRPVTKKQRAETLQYLKDIGFTSLQAAVIAALAHEEQIDLPGIDCSQR